MKIAFFISDHGFGHIMRNLPVAEELLKRGHEIIIVTGEKQAGVSLTYLENYSEDRLKFIICNTDAGLIVRPGTLIIDHKATVAKVRDHVERWTELIADAPGADAYVVDIVPWALTAAKEKGIPSFLISNFTWLDQYGGFLPKELLEKYENAYADADNVIFHALVNEPTRKLFGSGCEEAGFVARPFHMDLVAKIRDGHKRPIVFLSLGASNDGLDFEINVSGLPYDFISTQALKLIGDNVEYLDATVPNSQDYVKAADFCIAKAGWSTVSEAMIAGVPFAVLERDDTPEDTMTIAMLTNLGAALSLKAEEMRDMKGLLRRMEEYRWPEKHYQNNYGRVADIIIRHLSCDWEM